MCYCLSDIWSVNNLPWNNTPRQPLEQGSYHTKAGAGTYNSGTVRMYSAVASSDEGVAH